jgi:hypothetical protein
LIRCCPAAGERRDRGSGSRKNALPRPPARRQACPLFRGERRMASRNSPAGSLLAGI